MQKIKGPECPIIVGVKGHIDKEIARQKNALASFECGFKIGLNTLTANRNARVARMFAGTRWMYDAKFYDIPSTVAGYCEDIASWENPPAIVTIHASGGRRMCCAAVMALSNTPVNLVAVTVLTSLGDKESRRLSRRNANTQVLRLGYEAMMAGVNGLVCSAIDVPVLRKEYPKAMLIVPGGRFPEDPIGDQARTGHPQKILDEGGPNTYLVMGRRFTSASDPTEKMRETLERLGLPMPSSTIEYKVM
jgi:orotidine-5'-phosphate decarboxylase